MPRRPLTLVREDRTPIAWAVLAAGEVIVVEQDQAVAAQLLGIEMGRHPEEGPHELVPLFRRVA